jgi:hypothetical protein
MEMRTNSRLRAIDDLGNFGMRHAVPMPQDQSDPLLLGQAGNGHGQSLVLFRDQALIQRSGCRTGDHWDRVFRINKRQATVLRAMGLSLAVGCNRK